MTSLNCTSYLVTSAEVAKVCPDYIYTPLSKSRFGTVTMANGLLYIFALHCHLPFGDGDCAMYKLTVEYPPYPASLPLKTSGRGNEVSFWYSLLVSGRGKLRIQFLRKWQINYFTPRKTNMSHENQWLEDVFPIEIIPFLGTC